MKQAWRTTAMGIISIVAAETRGKAIAITMRSARSVGYLVKFHDVKAVRAPEYNAWAEVDASGACWDEKLLQRHTGGSP